MFRVRTRLTQDIIVEGCTETSLVHRLGGGRNGADKMRAKGRHGNLLYRGGEGGMAAGRTCGDSSTQEPLQPAASAAAVHGRQWGNEGDRGREKAERAPEASAEWLIGPLPKTVPMHCWLNNEL